MILGAHSLHTTPNIYVADYGNQQIAIIDAATDMVTTVNIPAMILGPPSAANPSCIAVAPNGTTACAGVNQYGVNPAVFEPHYAVTLAIIDSSFALINTPILIPELAFSQVSATCIAYTTDSNTVYVGCNPAGSLPESVIFPVTDLTGSPNVGAAISIPSGTPTDIAITSTSNGETAYIVTDTAAIYYMLTANNTPVLIATAAIPSLIGITISPHGETAYALGTDGTNGLIYSINTRSNTVNLASPITIPSETGPSGITTDGTYLYVTGAGSHNLYIIPIDNPTMINTVAVIGQPQGLTISSDASTLFLGYKNGDTNSYPTPSGSPAGTTVSLGGNLLVNSIATLPIPFTPSLLPFPPASVSGCKTQNVFLLQTDYINNITWTAPTTGTPAAYAIYRDAALTQLVSIVPASSPLQYYDHGRNPSVTYSYYIVSVDASGNQSAATNVTVTQSCS
jgi:hypothetical protein